MNFHEDLARIRVNEALEEGIAFQRVSRLRLKKSRSSIKTIIWKLAQVLGSVQTILKKEESSAPDLQPKLGKR